METIMHKQLDLFLAMNTEKKSGCLMLHNGFSAWMKLEFPATHNTIAWGNIRLAYSLIRFLIQLKLHSLAIWIGLLCFSP